MNESDARKTFPVYVRYRYQVADDPVIVSDEVVILAPSTADRMQKVLCDLEDRFSESQTQLRIFRLSARKLNPIATSASIH